MTGIAHAAQACERLSACGSAAISSSTFGRMRATITSTPAALGCRPSAWLQRAGRRHAVEEERIEQHAVFGGELRIDRIEGAAHSRRPRLGGARMPASSTAICRCAQPLQDPVERRARHLRIDPAQHVVGAELEDHGIGAVRHRPVEPREPAASRYRRRRRHCRSRRRCPLADSARCKPRHGSASLRGRPKPAVKRIAERHDLDRRRTARLRTAAPAASSSATKRRGGSSTQHWTQALPSHMSCHASPMRGAGRQQT